MIEINDTTKNSEVKFTLEYSREREVVNFTIIPHAEVVYFSKDRKRPLQPPEMIKLYLTNENTRDLCAALIANISIFFEETHGNATYDIDTVNGYKISIQRDKSDLKSKLIMTITDHGKEILVVRLRKNNAIILIDWIKNIFDAGSKQNFRLRVQNRNKYVYEVGRNKEGLLMIRSVILLQREMDVIRYLIDELIYTFTPKKLFTNSLSYKQVELFVDHSGNKMILLIKNRKNENKPEVHLEISPESVATLFLAINKISPLQKDTPSDLLLKPSHIIRIANVYVSFEKNEHEKYSYKEKKGGLKIIFADASKEMPVYIRFDMQEKWNLILSALVDIYHGRESVFNENGDFNYVWRFQYLQKDGFSKHIELRLVGKKENEQKAALIIKTSKSNNNSNNKVDEQIFISFTRNLLHGFITTFLSAADEIDGYEYSFVNHIDPKARFGIKKKKDTVEVSMAKDFKTILSPSDAALLKASARYKIFHDRWLGFQGENVTVSAEGYLTDLRREYHVEDNQRAAVSAYLAYKGEMA